MTTVQETPSIGEMLRKHRRDNKLTKAAMYRQLDVSPGTYDYWEGGVYVPGDEHAEDLADLLGFDIERVVWILYRSRLAKSDGKHHFRVVGLPTHTPIPIAA